jgi:DUF2911 family protein
MKKFFYFLALVALLTAVYFLRGPYPYPASWALGPCLMDWTSPSTWSPRASPLRSLDFQVDEVDVRVCYGSPSARERVLFGEGGIVPEGQRWRMGANEPTRLFTSGPILVGDQSVGPGRYSLYAITGPEAWRLFVNASTWHWGNMITEEVREQELFSIEIPVDTAATYAEELTFSSGGGALIFQWGATELQIPVRSASD